jgi:predicted RNA binding protein YcfA (HicA-like mRNA interferase family)
VKLSPQPWRKVIRALGRDGWSESHSKGSHRYFRHGTKPGLVCVPCHPKPIPVGTLREIIRQAGLTTEEFFSLL